MVDRRLFKVEISTEPATEERKQELAAQIAAALDVTPAEAAWFVSVPRIEKNMKSVFILYVNFRLSKHPCFRLDYGNVRQALSQYDEVTLAHVRQAIVDIRRSKLPDPAQLGNAGSFFKNPVIFRSQYEELCTVFPDMPCYEVDADHVKVPAGWLIEQAGWKGKALGRAAVHDRQALVLVNLGGAEGADVVALARAVQKTVADRFGIEIEPEVNFI